MIYQETDMINLGGSTHGPLWRASWRQQEPCPQIWFVFLAACLFRNQASTSFPYVFSYLIYITFPPAVSLKVIEALSTQNREEGDIIAENRKGEK